MRTGRCAGAGLEMELQRAPAKATAFPRSRIRREPHSLPDAPESLKELTPARRTLDFQPKPVKEWDSEVPGHLLEQQNNAKRFPFQF